MIACSTLLTLNATGQPAPLVEQCTLKIVFVIGGEVTASCTPVDCGRCGIEIYVTPTGATQYTCFCAS